MSDSSTDTPPKQFRAVVFREVWGTGDFSYSEAVVLPGVHTQQGAWQAVFTAMREGAIGGVVRPVSSA